MSDELLRKEHEGGLHNPPFARCPVCAEQSKAPLRPPPNLGKHLEDPIEPPPKANPGNLGPAFERIRRRITTYVEESDVAQEESLPVSPFDGGPMCDHCAGHRFIRKGDLPVEHPDFGKAFPCPTCYEPLLTQKRLDRLFGELGDKLSGHTLDNFEADSRPRRVALTKVREWLEDPGHPWLYLHGPVGIGKTHLAVGALKAWMEVGHSGAFKLSRDLLDRIRQGYNDPEQPYRDIMAALIETDLLVIDDLGSERHKELTDDDWASEKLFQIIGGRYDNNRRMIVTANFSLNGLAKRLGNQRVSSRILEMATTNYVVDMSRFPNFREIIAGLFSRGEDE